MKRLGLSDWQIESMAEKVNAIIYNVTNKPFWDNPSVMNHRKSVNSAVKGRFTIRHEELPIVFSTAFLLHRHQGIRDLVMQV